MMLSMLYRQMKMLLLRFVTTVVVQWKSGTLVGPLLVALRAVRRPRLQRARHRSSAGKGIVRTRTKLVSLISSVAVVGALGVAFATSGASAATGEESLFAETNTPATITDPDTSRVELGVKFSATVPGSVTGVKFYKGPQNTGTHTGELWNSSGTKLAQVTFTNETASGWQTARFASPVHVNANSTYTVSYQAPNARYSSTGSYFTSSQTHGDLKTPRNAGVYRYGGVAFPTQTYQASNYWVDLLFVPDGTSPSPSV